MSKAFTSEETPDAAPLLRAAPRLKPGEVRWVTREGHAAFAAELARLRAARAPLAAQDPAAADLDARAQLVSATLEALTVAPAPAAGERRVFLGAWVELEDEQGERRTWRLVGPDEADAKAGRVSVDSPLGRALLGKEAGDEVEVARPRGAQVFEIAQVRWLPPGEPR